RSAALGAFASLWYGFVISGLEGYQGFLEPIATLPALAGTLAWGGEPLRGRAGIARAIALGAGLGLAVFPTLKAAPPLGGFVALASGLASKEAEKRPEPRALAALPLAAILAFALALLNEGHGLLPLARGLEFAGRYRALGTSVS